MEQNLDKKIRTKLRQNLEKICTKFRQKMVTKIFVTFFVKLKFSTVFTHTQFIFLSKTEHPNLVKHKMGTSARLQI